MKRLPSKFNLRSKKYKRNPRTSHSKGMIMTYLVLGMLVASLMGGGAFSLYSRGKRAGIEEALSRIQTAQDALKEAQKKILAERTNAYEKALQESRMESLDYISELEVLRGANASLRGVLDKPPETITKYKECVYTEEDHNRMIDLYANLDPIESTDSNDSMVLEGLQDGD